VNKPSFGFSGLADIEPAPATKGNGIDLQEADRAAERLGFASRQGPVRRRKRQPIEEPVDQLNLRAAVADINAFVGWCEDNRYSYREGFAQLVKNIRVVG
jgi:hypothetical protein